MTTILLRGQHVYALYAHLKQRMTLFNTMPRLYHVQTVYVH
jgi:hypothetical protein